MRYCNADAFPGLAFVLAHFGVWQAQLALPFVPGPPRWQFPPGDPPFSHRQFAALDRLQSMSARHAGPFGPGLGGGLGGALIVPETWPGMCLPGKILGMIAQLCSG